MEIRNFTVPFGKIVGDTPELSFGPDDYCVVRPLFSRPASDVRALGSRVGAMDDSTEDEAVDQLILDLIDQCVIEWHLNGPAGPIAKPKTSKALNALPGVLRGALFTFLTSFRGEGANPTTGS